MRFPDCNAFPDLLPVQRLLRSRRAAQKECRSKRWRTPHPSCRHSRAGRGPGPEPSPLPALERVPVCWRLVSARNPRGLTLPDREENLPEYLLSIVPRLLPLAGLELISTAVLSAPWGCRGYSPDPKPESPALLPLAHPQSQE